MSAPRRRRPTSPGADLRAELTAKMRERCELHRATVLLDGAKFVAPWPRLLAQLEAGEPVELEAFQLPAWARPAGASGRVLVDADGTVSTVERS